jgi:hypothetical protein
MTTFKDISISISHNRRSLSGTILYILGPGTVFYGLYTRQPDNPFLKALSNCRLWCRPEWFSVDDYSKATILHLKIEIAWHNGNYRRYKMDPWDLVVFPAEGGLPLPDSARLVDIANGVYGKHGEGAQLCVVNKQRRRRGLKAWWTRKGREDRVVPEEVVEVLRGRGGQVGRDFEMVQDDSEEYGSSTAKTDF